MSVDLAAKAFDTAYAQLRGQKEDLKFYRNQASICAAVSGLIASVFVGLTKTNAKHLFGEGSEGFLGISIIGLLVLCLFAGSIACASMAVIGWRKCDFDINPEVMLHAFEQKRDTNELWFQLTRDAQGFFTKNEMVIDDAKFYLALSLYFAFAQIPAWMLLLT